ncbi:MAG: hypothetical protein ACIARR_11410 [Phycisphaerales bacterium JB059]
MLEWMRDRPVLVTVLTGVSLAGFVISLVLAPIIAASIPPAYFAHDRRPSSRFAGRRPVVRWGLRIGKNLLGGVLMLGGVAMLVLPGQGLLTMLVGGMLIDFPGKYRFEKWLMARSWVRRPINWLRRRRGRAELVLTPASGPGRGANPSGPA